MGCDTYHFDNCTIHFSEMDDEFGCLCTFPHNDTAMGETLTPHRLRSLALLGAAIVLIQHGEVNCPVFIPQGLPQWIVDGVRKLIPEDGNEIQSTEGT